MALTHQCTWLVLASALLLACGSVAEEPRSTSASSSSTSSGGGGDGGTGATGGAGGAGGDEDGPSDFVEPTALGGSYEETASSLALGAKDVYWASVSVLPDNKYVYGIKKAPKEQGEDAYEIGDVWPLAIAVDATDLFWTDGSAILKRPLGGGDITTIATAQKVEPGASIAVDDTSVYWPNRDYGSVMKAAKDGSSSTPIALGQYLPMRVAVDDTHVYWVNATDPGSISSAPKDGGPPFVIADMQRYPSALAVDATHVYWTSTGDSSVQKAPKGGGPAEVIATSQFSSSIAVDATHIYWLRADLGVARAPLEGGPVTALSVEQTGCSEIALDDGFVYWTRNAVTKGPKVLRLAK